jgi:hypothetical protein
MDVTTPVKQQFDRLLEATRERPGVALAIAVGGGILLGFFSSSLIGSKRILKAVPGAESEGEQVQAIKRANESMAFSGESTPASSVAGDTLGI